MAPKARNTSGSFFSLKLKINKITRSKNPFISIKFCICRKLKPLKSGFLIITSLKSLSATAASMAAVAGRRAYITEHIHGLSLNFLSIFEIIIIIKNEGSIIDIVATIEPKIPAVLKPAKVATFKPTGPGVMLEIASILESSSGLNQP